MGLDRGDRFGCRPKTSIDASEMAWIASQSWNLNDSSRKVDLRRQNTGDEGKMPEKSRGRKATKATGGRMETVSNKNVSFQAELMDIDAKFEELKKPMYKGKRLDDPIASPVVRPIHFCESNSRINGSCYRHFSRSKDLLNNMSIRSITLSMSI
jgi:hypothetical protein